MNLYREIIVCYDVSENKARKKIADGLKDFGMVPIQKSVFWGELLPAEEKAVLKLLQKWIAKGGDDRAFLVPASLSSRIQDWSVGYSGTADELFQKKAYCVV